MCRLVARPEPRAPSGTFCARRLVARRRPHTAGALMRIGPATCRRFRHFRRVFYVQALFFRLLVVRFVMQADDLHTSRWRRTGPAAAARTASPGARPRRSPGGAGQSFLDGPAAGLTSRPAAPRRRAAEAPASPARIRGPIAGSRRLGGGGVRFGLAEPISAGSDPRSAQAQRAGQRARLYRPCASRRGRTIPSLSLQANFLTRFDKTRALADHQLRINNSLR